MRYFIDCEFLEGPQKTWWGGRTKPTIDLISIGIVAEDGREYYAISSDFNLDEAWNRYDIVREEFGIGFWDATEVIEEKEYWIRNNVLRSIWIDLIGKDDISPYSKDWAREGSYKKQFTKRNLKRLLKKNGKGNEEISTDIINFLSVESTEGDPLQNSRIIDHDIAFYGYMCDFDYVAMTWLFGGMSKWPEGFPYYFNDLAQMKDEKVVDKYHPDFPKESDEHNALSDARWNKKLYDFITNLK